MDLHSAVRRRDTERGFGKRDLDRAVDPRTTRGSHRHGIDHRGGRRASRGPHPGGNRGGQRHPRRDLKRPSHRFALRSRRGVSARRWPDAPVREHLRMAARGILVRAAVLLLAEAGVERFGSHARVRIQPARLQQQPPEGVLHHELGSLPYTLVLRHRRPARRDGRVHEARDGGDRVLEVLAFRPRYDGEQHAARISSEVTGLTEQWALERTATLFSPMPLKLIQFIMKENTPTPLAFTFLIPFFLTLLILIIERVIGRNENILPIAPWFVVVLLIAYIPMLLLFAPFTTIAYRMFLGRQWVLFGGITLIPIVGIFLFSIFVATLRDLPRSCRWMPTQQVMDSLDKNEGTSPRCAKGF